MEEIAFSCGIIKKTKIFIKKRKICYVGVDFVWIFLHICGVLRAGCIKIFYPRWVNFNLNSNFYASGF